MRVSRCLLTVFCSLALAGCHKELPLCGDPAFGKFVAFEILDDATGQSWFAQPGRPPGDSLRLLAYAFGPAQRATRVGSAYRLGPINIDGRPSYTLYLRFSAQDVDTVVTQLRYATLTGPDPCGYGPALAEVSLTYNGRPAGTFRASVPADSLDQIYLYASGKVIRLRKRG